MRDVICNRCDNSNDLVNMLKEPFHYSNYNHIISLLSAKTISKKDGKARYNLSFATKFASYAAKFLKTNIEYPKYDNIVANALPTYMKVYLDKIRKPNEYKINEYQRKKLDDDGNYQYRFKMYDRYFKDIIRIIDDLQINGIDLTLEEFDHIIWYCFKG